MINMEGKRVVTGVLLLVQQQYEHHLYCSCCAALQCVQVQLGKCFAVELRLKLVVAPCGER